MKRCHVFPTGSCTLDETPWVKAIETIGSDAYRGNVYAVESRFIAAALATARATEQLLPALKMVIKEHTAANATLSSRSDDLIGNLFTAMAEKLLALLPLDPASAKTLPSLHVDFPKRGGRVGGSLVPFVAEVSLGATLEARLAEVYTAEEVSARAHAYGNERRSEEHQTSWPSSLPGTSLPPLEGCKLRILVDDVEAALFPVDPSGTTTILQAWSPVYAPRCSKHPEHDTAVAAGKQWWVSDKDAWYVEARTVDRVCIRDDFSSHRMHAELFCCNKGRDGVLETLATASGAGQSAEGRRGGAAAASTATPERVSPICDTLSTTSPIEYLHTGNGAMTTKHPADDKVGARMSPLWDPLNDNVSISLYLDRAPDTSAVVTVPRWGSDGKVWKVGSDFEGEVELQSKMFTYSIGTMSNEVDIRPPSLR